jgi:hypothetical protein
MIWYFSKVLAQGVHRPEVDRVEEFIARDTDWTVVGLVVELWFVVLKVVSSQFVYSLS